MNSLFYPSSFCQLIANYASLCAVELEVNEEITVKDKITASCLKNILPKTSKMKSENVRLRSFQKPTILIHFNLLQVCPSVLTFVKFAVLVIPSLILMFHSIWFQFLPLEF